MTTDGRDESTQFEPRWDVNGLVAVVVVDEESRAVLMVAHANREAIARTRDTGLAHFWSRSRQSLWCKGETSGNTLRVSRIRVDCDQDALIYDVAVGGGVVACHTGRRSCFYRELESDGSLRFID